MFFIFFACAQVIFITSSFVSMWWAKWRRRRIRWEKKAFKANQNPYCRLLSTTVRTFSRWEILYWMEIKVYCIGVDFQKKKKKQKYQLICIKPFSDYKIQDTPIWLFSVVSMRCANFFISLHTFCGKPFTNCFVVCLLILSKYIWVLQTATTQAITMPMV